ncbi:anti-sigma regulatory factor (Ser/Thr protein kinase) [Thermocatellispora tengchongensis]|uniref:Anti-sigma regulatory factor (Ser/Thr protein kinase) n=1 Tax=Thermocatellispora tengchongensis TaxID=1073253 RepID=A0A840P9G0_9ACTN|nr:ATP-binding protein [Thermocatellispora tengchongensis]MBB5136298.1 anti-sigma regulatory factor (Ser/Thr protein kinase) [Thermocatellispora tengchongensis]
MSTADRLQIQRRLGFAELLYARASDTATCPLPPQADSVKLARDVTRNTLRNWGLNDLGDDAALVVSELVTNAVRYAMCPRGTSGELPITLMLLRLMPHVLLAVADPSDEAPVPKEPDFISENGRGLYIVETYSQRWGWDRLENGGKAVWALFGGDGFVTGPGQAGAAG